MLKESLEKKEERQILVFRVAGEELGLDISCVREVLRPQKIYPLPKIPDFIEGVINLRGHIVALIDLRKRLHAQPKEDEPNKRIIICKVNPVRNSSGASTPSGINVKSKPAAEQRGIISNGVNQFIVGLMVNTLKEIIALSKEDIKPIPELVSRQMEAEVLSGLAKVGERIIPILDLEHILTKKEVIELSALKR
jgi:purine-binding chemotaxis protein CheW